MPKGLLVSSFVLWAAPLSAQFGVFSPYSRLGLGMPYHDVLAPAGFLGASASAARGQALVNPTNPASYSALENLMLQFGMEAQRYRQTRGNEYQTGHHAFFSQFALALPLPPRKMALVAGYLPFTATRYLYTQSDTLITPSDTLAAKFTYEGFGGVDKFFLGWGATVFPGLSVGFNGLLYLGNIQRDKITEFPSGQGFINTRFRETQRVRGGGLELGLQYQKQLKKIHFTVGLSGEWGFSARSQENYQVDYFFGSYGSDPLHRDTLYAVRSRVHRPSVLRAAFALGKPGIWQAYAGWDQSFWSQYRRSGAVENLLGDRAARSLAVEYAPFRNNAKGPISRSVLTFSARHTTEAFRPSSSPFQSFGIGFGLSLPMLTNSLMDRKLSSWLSAGMEYNFTRHPSADVTRQNTLRFIFAVSLRDKWAPKFKYN